MMQLFEMVSKYKCSKFVWEKQMKNGNGVLTKYKTQG